MAGGSPPEIDANGICEVSTEFEGQLSEYPKVIGAVQTHLKIRVLFDKPMKLDSALVNRGNYTVHSNTANAVDIVVISVTPGAGDEPEWVDLVVSEATSGGSYYVEVALAPYGPTDADGVPLDPANHQWGFLAVAEDPTIKSVIATSANTVEVTFSETMFDNGTIRDPSRYSFDGGLNVLSVSSFLKDTVTLVTDDQVPGQLYTLTVTQPALP